MTELVDLGLIVYDTDMRKIWLSKLGWQALQKLK